MRKVADTSTPITAKELGRHLGLSQPTVSRILSGAAGHRVSDETRRRVLEAAEQMGYRPNAIARSLRRRSTDIVGFYTGYGYLDANNPFQAQLIGGLQRAAEQHRVDILLHGVYRGGSTEDIFGELVDGRIDGLFVNTHAADPLVVRLRDSSLPVVAVADAIPGVPSVVADDAGGTEILLDYLWEKGHRRIGYVRPEHKFSSVERRVAAFRAWHAERGLAPGAEYEIQFEFSMSALDTLLATPAAERPTAVCCWNDMAAFDLLYRCRLRGVNVPAEFAIVGFDGLLADPRLNPRALVTVGADWNAVTDNAMNLLIRQRALRGIGGAPEGADPVPLLTCLPVSLMQGDTV
jgi:DNA-binding LacI/PurR family transcriptional regulator